MSISGFDDNDFRVVRKTLNALSVLISILAFTKAEINALNFLGIDIDLDGRKLYIALFIGYSYFIWRYCTKVPLVGGFWLAFLNFYFESGSGVKKQHTYERYRNWFVNSPEVKEVLAKGREVQLVQMQAVRPSGRTMRNPRLSATYHTSTDTGGRNVTVNHDITVSWLFVTRKLLIFSFRHDKFGDYIFPILMVGLNVCFFFFRRGWQGSIWSLF